MAKVGPKRFHSHIIGPSWVLVLRWITTCYWELADVRKAVPYTPTQREVRADPKAHGPKGPVFVTAPPVPVERPRTVRVTETARTDATNGTQRGAAMFEGPKIWVPALDISESERAKR